MTQTQKAMCEIYGEGAVNRETWPKWFTKLDTVPRFHSPADQIKALHNQSYV